MERGLLLNKIHIFLFCQQLNRINNALKFVLRLSLWFWLLPMAVPHLTVTPQPHQLMVTPQPQLQCMAIIPSLLHTLQLLTILSQHHTTLNHHHTTLSHTIQTLTNQLPTILTQHHTMPPPTTQSPIIPTQHLTIQLHTTQNLTMDHPSAARAIQAHGALRIQSTQPMKSKRPSSITMIPSSRCTRMSSPTLITLSPDWRRLLRKLIFAHPRLTTSNPSGKLYVNYISTWN